jgi:hypothetical protein
MADLVLNGDTSGSVTLKVPAIAGATVVTMPTTTGTLMVASGSFLTANQGGTGVGNIAANAVVLGNGTSPIQTVAPGAAGNVLTSNGTTWVSQLAAAFDAGTRLGFQQTAAPTGWTKDTTAGLNDSMMRIVTGTASSGGSTAFSTWSAATAVGATTLSTAQIPGHTHTTIVDATDGYYSGTYGSKAGITGSTATGSAGGGGSHDHSVTRNLKYYDFIIAVKT